MNTIQQLTKELQAQTAHSLKLEYLAKETLAMLDKSLSPHIDVENVDQWYRDIETLRQRLTTLTQEKHGNE